MYDFVTGTAAVEAGRGPVRPFWEKSLDVASITASPSPAGILQAAVGGAPGALCDYRVERDHTRHSTITTRRPNIRWDSEEAPQRVTWPASARLAVRRPAYLIPSAPTPSTSSVVFVQATSP